MTEQHDEVEDAATQPAPPHAHAGDAASEVQTSEGGSAPSGVLTTAPPAAPSATRFVYALGKVEPRFPSLAVEKEFAQVAGRGDTAGLTDRQALQSLLSDRANRYLARKLCWVFTIEGLETYVLRPRDPLDVDLLIDGLRPRPRATDVDVVIGVLGPIATPEMCNGLMVPIVAFDHLYSFDVDALIDSIPRPDGADDEQFEPAAEELFTRIMQMSDNAGATDADRALNYLSVRYPAIYHKAAEQFAADASLTGVHVRVSPLSGARTVMDVIFAYTDRKTDVTDKYRVRVDVTEQFPFLVTKLSPFVDQDA